MPAVTPVIEKCPDTSLWVVYIPGYPGVHTQGAALEELKKNLIEVAEMLFEDLELQFEFVGTPGSDN